MRKRLEFPDGEAVVFDEFPGSILPESGRVGRHGDICRGTVETFIDNGKRHLLCNKNPMGGCDFHQKVSSVPKTVDELITPGDAPESDDQEDDDIILPRGAR